MNVVFSIRNQKRQCGEMVDDLTVRLRLRETLQEFLQYQPRAINGSCLERSPKFVNLRNIGRRIAAQGR
jgi:hypothetical protein